jgi:flagellar hook capping protein FlgD
MHGRAAILVAALLGLVPATSRAALSTYTQNFESLVKSNPTALSGDGWLVYGNVYAADHTYLYGYGPYPAPNGSGAFCAVDTLQGGPLQGDLQLSVYSDYNNTGAHGAGQLVESNVYHEQTIDPADVGSTWTFQFDAKLGNLTSPTTAVAFIKTLNPAAGYTLTNFLTVDVSTIPATWNTYSISIDVDPTLSGQLMQFGFANTATSFNPSGVFYDNLVWSKTAGVGVDPRRVVAFELRPAAPNPFRVSTRVDFTMSRAGHAEVSVHDAAGRLVTTLFSGPAEAGPHAVTWNGRYGDGRRAPNGVYSCTLRTDSGRQTRNLVLSH